MSDYAHLHKISISGYKSIKQVDLEMRPINILIGANGSGKSNFISIFSLLRNLSQGRFQNFVRDSGGANSLLHFGTRVTSSIMIDLDVGSNSYHAELDHDLFEDTLSFSREYCRFDLSSRTFPIKGRNGESGLYDGDASSPWVRDYTKDYLNKCRVYHFHDTGSTAGFKQSANISSTDYLYSDAKNIAPFLYMLREQWRDSYNNILDAVRTIAPFFHDFFLEPRGEGESQSILLKWTHRRSDEPFSAQQLSDGTARFICLATLFLQPDSLKPQTIILDEPELGLHPAALEVLSDIIKSTSKDTQVICSTQSVTFSNHFNPEDFIVVNQQNGVSTFERLDVEKLKVWLDEYRMGDLWNKNLIGGRPEW